MDIVHLSPYLDATVSNKGGGAEDMHNRICKSRVAFMKLKQIMNSRKLILRTKIKLYKFFVMSVLLYVSETWKMNEQDNKKLDTFYFTCLRRILQIR